MSNVDVFCKEVYAITMNGKEILQKLQEKTLHWNERQMTRRASVLLPMIQRKDELYLLFEVRSEKIIQGKEVCFPGGQIDEGESPEDAAIRETVEELLVDRRQITVLAEMPEMNGPGGSLIYPFVGLLKDYEGTYSQDEVGRVFELPLSWLLQQKPDVYQTEYKIELPEDFPYDRIPGGRSYTWRKNDRNVYFYETKEALIWGFTAEVLYYFLEECKNLTDGRESENYGNEGKGISPLKAKHNGCD